MRKRSVVTPLTVGFLFMELLMGGLLILTFWYTGQLFVLSTDIINSRVYREIVAVRLQSNLLHERWATDRYLASGDPADRAEAEAARTQADNNVAELRKQQDEMTSVDWDAFSADYQSYHALLDGLLYYSSEEDADLQAIESQADAVLDDLGESIMAMEEAIKDQIEKEGKTYTDFFNNRRIVLVVGAGLIAIGAVTGLTLGRYFISLPLARLAEAARQLGSGDLTAVPEIPTPNEIGTLATSFRQMAASLAQAIERMRGTAGTLTASTDQLSTSATNLSGLARGTLAQMEQVAQGAEEQREQMRTAADVAAGLAAALRQGAQQAGEVGQAARDAQAKLEQTSRTVAVLDRDAEEIQSITAIIEQFAQETHMLSLNAAIEARRAGEAGRGFAAVSDEMRALAERSSRSASRVARFGARAQAEMESVGQAVTEVLEAVTQTADFAGQTVDAAQRQEQDTTRLADIVAQSAAVSETQAQIAEQVSAAVAEQVDAIAELATAAQELAELAGQLEALSARFVTH